MLSPGQRSLLKSHFAFSRPPFNKAMRASLMFESTSQTELVSGLDCWANELRGIGLVAGESGVGKSIALRRFLDNVDDRSNKILRLTYLPSTVTGFLRSLCRLLGQDMRAHSVDLFHAAQDCLQQREGGPHSILVIDDAEGISESVLDTIRRLTIVDLDRGNAFSVLLAGTEELARTIRQRNLESLRTRITYAYRLRGFTLDDTKKYVRFQLKYAGLDKDLFSEDAVRKMFQASAGHARKVNQLAIHAFVAAATQSVDAIDGPFMARQIANHPLYGADGDE